MAKIVGGVLPNWSFRLLGELNTAQKFGLVSAFPAPVGVITSWAFLPPKVGGFLYMESAAGQWRADGDGWVRQVVTRGAAPALDIVSASGLTRGLFPDRIAPGGAAPAATRYTTSTVATPAPIYTNGGGGGGGPGGGGGGGYLDPGLPAGAAPDNTVRNLVIAALVAVGVAYFA